MYTSKTFSVAILGAGHGGLALAGYLSRHGHRVALWNRSPERVAPVAALGGIRLQVPGEATRFAPVPVATADIAAALADTRLVLVAVPACGHADVARTCTPHLRDGQKVLLVPGRTGGALEFQRVLRERLPARLLVGETDTFPFAARCIGPAAAHIYGIKDDIRAAALPATRTPELVMAWRRLLPMLLPARSVLHTGLGNLGAILHPVITLLNADRIRARDSFDFYTEGVTGPVASVLAAADAERLRIARAYGVAVRSLPAWIAAAYGHHGHTVQEAVGGNPAYVGIKAPTTLEHRYLLEDVPTGLIPLLELGDAAGLSSPTLRGLVDRARIELGGEPWSCPRTLGTLGLLGFSTADIRSFVERGRTSVPKKVPVSSRRFGAGLELIPQFASGV